jgi:hypothetical protein
MLKLPETRYEAARYPHQIWYQENAEKPSHHAHDHRMKETHFFEEQLDKYYPNQNWQDHWKEWNE